ncbi:hypothetical protein [Lactobacillus bombicola]|jgi:cyanate permease|uniref:Uncharacterized protein n=1 Tax=Lactobacillus bombicola TaxID=1505723 RepID=A0A396SYU9_9LACO|nr:hypothetical protein [Lactobacillus bombicola]RHW51632.1 hypothetical protein DS833_02250 [Lactobacillus bombicola]RHW54941.1 hypothetical protein DS835_02180 [Lactobacillus bombicola]
MKKQSIFPIVYGLISALIAFIAVFFIAQHSFNWEVSLSILVASFFAIIFFILSWFRGHASVEIKRIASEFNLSDEDLAQITGMKKTDFPIYNNKLQLILPKHYWPRVLDALQKYERERKSL